MRVNLWLTERFVNFATKTYSTPRECCCTSNVSKTLSKIFPFFANKSDVPFKYSMSSRKLPMKKRKSHMNIQSVDDFAWFFSWKWSKCKVKPKQNSYHSLDACSLVRTYILLDCRRLTADRKKSLFAIVFPFVLNWIYLTNSMSAHYSHNVLKQMPSYCIYYYHLSLFNMRLSSFSKR